jgi:2-enoate reductase
MSKYEHLSQPVSIGKLLIKNRIAMAPMNDLHQFYDPIEGTINRRWIDYFSERAKGGVGLIITGVFKVEDEITHFRQNGFSTWALLSKKSRQNYAELAKYVHTFGGRIFMQISAGPGRVLGGGSIDEGFEPISSSENQAYFRPDKSCRPLRTEEVAKLVEAFANAAELVAMSGIDGMEIHGHEGYLIDQFATALWNRRTDKYGGDLEGRLTFAKEIVAAIKEKVGEDFPVMYRYGSKHFIRAPLKGTLKQNNVELGRDIGESIQMARILERSGYDALHVDAGCYESAYWAHPPMYFQDGPLIELTRQIKSAVAIPVIAVGRLGDPDLAEKVLADGKADMIALGRDLLSDPYWPKKVIWGEVEDIRRCIGCHECMYRAENGQYLTCAINPFCGNEGVVNIKRSTDQKKVAVVGGGIAGMEAARVASLKGYDVTLYEKNQELGGHAIAGGVPGFKRDIRMLLDWYKAKMKESKIKIETKVEVTEEMLTKSHPDSIIVATGSIARKPDIPGIDGPQVHHCIDVLLGKSKVNTTTVVIGGGVLGCETGLWLAQQGAKVTIVDMLPSLANDIHRSNRAMLLQLLEDYSVTQISSTKIVEINDKGVVCVNDKLLTSFIDCNSVVLALGLTANSELYRSLVWNGIEAYAIGDCVQPRKIADAVWEANMLMLTI